MKILHVGPKNFPPAHGGVEKIVYDICQEMKNADNFIFVEWLQNENDNIKILPKGIFKQICFIASFIKHNNIEITNFHKESFIPHALIASLSLKKTVLTLHGCAWRIERWAWHYRLVFYMLDILACIFVPKVIFVGQTDYRHFSKIVFWRKLFHIPNGVETNDFESSDDASKCVFIGRISPEKNILRLIDMFYSGDNKLTIYGPFDKHDRSYEVKVMAAIGSNPNVSYAGVLAHNEILPTLAKYNTFYNISFSEGMPVSVLEAASVGLNLVLSDIPQHSDLKFPDAVYVNPHAPHIQTKFYGKSMNNKNHVENNYSIQQTVDQYRKLYERLNNE